ncbi:VF530 family protein [Pseudomonas sp. RIT-PI-S]|uniref:VF530 family protein n=1 Tax=Pseudomonas sp. RIT-PI-S TaxID=3035295 RepID=UPI0021D9CBD0|nr:VF530 family protein [Pseudomonas sp. RIT-PI-S]
MTHTPDNPLHGVTLEKLLTELVAHHGWAELARRVDIRCFKSDPSIKSSLTFLRKTPWAREKVEALFIELRQRQA